MGAVYKAFDQSLEEDVAIKVLRTDLGKADELGKRFRSEIKLARKVRHKNVCTIHDYGEEGPLLYISMELVEGVDLREMLAKRGRLPPGEALDISIPICQGLEAIHAAKIVHRDLKPQNLMMQPDGVIRLMDFGIAKRVGGETTAQTRTGQIIGTPEYMSPEQARGEKVDLRSDIYAAGILIFELFTGRVPFRGETPIGTIMKHIEEPPPLEGEAARGLPPGLVPIVRSVLAKDINDRPASISKLLLELATTPVKPSQPTGVRDEETVELFAGGTASSAATVALIEKPATPEPTPPLLRSSQSSPGPHRVLRRPLESEGPTELRRPTRRGGLRTQSRRGRIDRRLSRLP